MIEEQREFGLLQGLKSFKNSFSKARQSGDSIVGALKTANARNSKEAVTAAKNMRDVVNQNVKGAKQMRQSLGGYNDSWALDYIKRDEKVAKDLAKSAQEHISNFGKKGSNISLGTSRPASEIFGKWGGRKKMNTYFLPNEMKDITRGGYNNSGRTFTFYK